MSDATCAECGHSWSLRKGPEEIETPLCSECGARGSSITLESDNSDLSIVERSRRKKQRAELLQEIEFLVSDLNELAPDGQEVPPELPGEHAQLIGLQEALGSSELSSKPEMNEVEGELETIREAVESFDYVEQLPKTIEKKSSELTSCTSRKPLLRKESRS